MIINFKEELLHHLSDDEFAKKVSKLLSTKAKKLSAMQIKRIKIIRNYWNEISQVKNNRLFYVDKMNLLDAYEYYGELGLKKLLDKMVASPLNNDDNVYRMYIQDLGWILREQNLDKISRGFYDEKKGKYDDLFEED